MNKNELITSENKDFLSIGNLNFTDFISDELAGLDNQFDKIKIPAGGGLNFEIPNLENAEEPTTVKEFSAVILHHHPLFTYYKSKYNGSNNPPDCCSFDGITGFGFPGGNCKSCNLNAFGSGENGSKACKNKHRIYFLRENEIFPIILILPASSIRELSNYLKRLISRGKKSEFVVTKLSLKKAVNKTGIAYSQVHFSVDRDLTEQEKSGLTPLMEEIKLCSKNSNLQQIASGEDINL